MELLEPKFKYGDEVFRIKYNNKKGEITDCNKCNHTGRVSLPHIDTNYFSDCPYCNGLGVYRPEYKIYSIDDYSLYTITGLYYDEESDSIKYTLSKLEISPMSLNESWENYHKNVSETEIFLNEEDAQDECNKRNIRK